MSQPKQNASNSDENFPSTIRICHLADIHLGYRRYSKVTKAGINQREADVNLAFQEAIERIISLRPHLTIIAGDLFHAVRPSNSVLTFCFRQLRKLAQSTGAPIVVVGGNHEAPKRSDTGSPLELLSEIPGVHVAGHEAEWFRFKDIDAAVLALPHQVFAERNTPDLRADDAYRFNILAAHAQVEEDWISDFGGIDIAFESLSPHEWDYIALGHVHLYRRIRQNGSYSGSLEHTSANIWAEAKELKGFLEIELPSLKRTFHPLTSPREVISLQPLDLKDVEPQVATSLIADSLNSVAGGLEGKIVRLELLNLTREGYRYLDHKELRIFRAKALNLMLEVRPPEVVSVKRKEGLKIRRGLNSELKEYLASAGTPPDLKEKVTGLITSYLERVEREHEAS